MDFKKLRYYVYDKGNVSIGTPSSVTATYSSGVNTLHLTVACEFKTNSDDVLHVKEFEAICSGDELPERILILSSNYDQFLGIGKDAKQSTAFLELISKKLNNIKAEIEATQATIATTLENN